MKIIIDIIKSQVRPLPIKSCSWEEYRMEMDAWKPKKNTAINYLASEHGRMALIALIEQIGRRPKISKINKIAATIDRELYRAIIILQTYLARKITLKQNMQVGINYTDLPNPTRVGIYINENYSRKWYQSNYS